MAIDAKLWGWVNRDRLFWLSCEGKQGAEKTNLARTHRRKIQLPEVFSLSQRSHTTTVVEVKRDIAKAWPGTVLFEDGFTLAVAPGDGNRRIHISPEKSTNRKTG